VQDKSVRRRSILIFIILFELILIFALLAQFYYVFAYNNNLEVMDYQAVTLDVKMRGCKLTQNEAKLAIEELFNIEHTYIETTELSDKVFADSNIVRKEVRIKPDLLIEEYVISYTHELVHIKYESYDETFTAFKTFVELYESGNEELMNVSYIYAQSVMDGCYVGTDYDCGYYIVEYLKEINFPIIEETE